MKKSNNWNNIFNDIYEKETNKTEKTLNYLNRRAHIYSKMLTELLYDEPSKLLKQKHSNWEKEVKYVEAQYDKILDDIIEEVDNFKKFSDNFRNNSL